MDKGMNCKVIMWFVNYEGKLYDPCIIAEFRTVKWAERFLKELNEEIKNEVWQDVRFTLVDHD